MQVVAWNNCWLPLKAACDRPTPLTRSTESHFISPPASRPLQLLLLSTVCSQFPGLSKVPLDHLLRCITRTLPINALFACMKSPPTAWTRPPLPIRHRLTRCTRLPIHHSFLPSPCPTASQLRSYLTFYHPSLHTFSNFFHIFCNSPMILLTIIDALSPPEDTTKFIANNIILQQSP